MGLLEVFFPPILTPEGREFIKKHQYVPGVKSWLMPVYNYWWEIAVSFVPSYIAPNLLTLAGFACSLIGFYTYCYFEPQFLGSYDSTSLYLFEFLCLFLYQTLDAIDGKHARNTKNSSPLGQLFDHGADAVTATFSIYIHAGIFGVGTHWKGLYVLVMSQVVFYALNWRARHTGQFDFGRFSVDETMTLGMVIFTVTAFKGTAYWQDWALFGYDMLNPQNFLLVSLSMSIVHNCTKCLYHVNKYYQSVTCEQEKKFYGERFYELGNLLMFHAALVAWNLIGIFNEYPIMFLSTVAATFAHLVHRLIICDVTKQKSRKIQYIIIPFVVIAPLSVLEYLTQKPVLLGLSMKDYRIAVGVLLYTTYIMLVYAMRCMIDISNTLEIRIFLTNAPKTSDRKNN